MLWAGFIFSPLIFKKQSDIEKANEYGEFIVNELI